MCLAVSSHKQMAHQNACPVAERGISAFTIFTNTLWCFVHFSSWEDLPDHKVHVRQFWQHIPGKFHCFHSSRHSLDDACEYSILESSPFIWQLMTNNIVLLAEWMHCIPFWHMQVSWDDVEGNFMVSRHNLIQGMYVPWHFTEISAHPKIIIFHEH